MAQAALKPTPLKADVLLEVMSYSRYGALAQLFVMDALYKGYKPEPKHRNGRKAETNEDLVKRLLKADAMRDSTDVLDVVMAHAKGVSDAGLEGVRESFAKSKQGMVHPDSWHGVAVEIMTKLQAAA